MTKAGERYWRLHVEYQALPEEERSGPPGEANREQAKALWETLGEADKTELVARQKVAEGT